MGQYHKQNFLNVPIAWPLILRIKEHKYTATLGIFNTCRLPRSFELSGEGFIFHFLEYLANLYFDLVLGLLVSGL